MILLVTGSREWSSPDTVETVLTRVWHEAGRPEGFTVRHGAARGVDTIADNVAGMMRWKRDPHPVSPRAWKMTGRYAGQLRNQHMVNLGADLCVAFISHCTKPGCRRPQPHGSHGATGCADLAREAGIPVEIYRDCDSECPCRGES